MTLWCTLNPLNTPFKTHFPFLLFTFYYAISALFFCLKRCKIGITHHYSQGSWLCSASCSCFFFQPLVCFFLCCFVFFFAQLHILGKESTHKNFNHSLFLWLLSEPYPGLQRVAGSRYLRALASPRSESEPRSRRRPSRADGSVAAVFPEPGQKHEAHLPQPCGAGCSKLGWV